MITSQSVLNIFKEKSVLSIRQLLCSPWKCFHRYMSVTHHFIVYFGDFTVSSIPMWGDHCAVPCGSFDFYREYEFKKTLYHVERGTLLCKGTLHG